MELRANIARKIVHQDEKEAATQACAREIAMLIEAAIDGEYLLPGFLFEANKHLFDAGMRNLCRVLAVGVGREIRYGFSVERMIPGLLVD